MALYNAVNHTDYNDSECLDIKTLKDALYLGVKNDVGYVFHDIMNLIEHQSTYNPNMPLRGLGYFSDMYIEYISEEFKETSVIYLPEIVHLPTPRYFVMYNGIEKMQDDIDLRLSEAYEGPGDIEVVAHMLNINKGHNRALLEACKPLNDYSELVARIRKYKAEGYSNEESVFMAVDSCIDDGILEDLLRKERDKVTNILYRGLTEEELEHYQQMRLDLKLRKGIEQGAKEKGFDAVSRLVAEGILDAEKACEILDVSFDEYRKHCSEIEI